MRGAGWGPRSCIAAIAFAGVVACSRTLPPPTAACDEIARVARQVRSTTVEQRVDSFPAFTGEMRRHGCVVEVAGAIDAEDPVPVFVTSFPDSLGPEWSRDDQLVADGPATTVYGLWQGEVLCLVRVDWSVAGDPPDGPREAGADYRAVIGCERLEDGIVPRS